MPPILMFTRGTRGFDPPHLPSVESSSSQLDSTPGEQSPPGAVRRAEGAFGAPEVAQDLPLGQLPAHLAPLKDSFRRLCRGFAFAIPLVQFEFVLFFS